MYSQFMMHGQKNIKLWQSFGRACTGLISFTIGTCGGLLWIR